MSPTSRSFLNIVLLWLGLSCTLAIAEDRPMTGKKATAYAAIDKTVLQFMDTIGCQAATVAISIDGKLVYSRGYGWIDEAKKKPVPPDALMRIASVSKPITATVVKKAIRAGQLSLDAKAFDLIAVKPRGGKVADPRIKNITVRQLLEHKGGWDRDTAFDPMFRTREVENDLQLSKPATSTNVIQYMLTQPLQFAPGRNRSTRILDIACSAASSRKCTRSRISTVFSCKYASRWGLKISNSGTVLRTSETPARFGILLRRMRSRWMSWTHMEG